MRLVQFLEAIQEIPSILKGLAAEAHKAPTFEEFERDFIGQIKHGTYWHLTDNPQFTIDPKLGPRDQSSIAVGSSMDPGKLMITSHFEYWNDFYNGETQTRPYAALIDMSNVPREAYYQVNRGFGNEFFVSDPSKTRVVAVMPIEKAMQYNEQAHSALPQSQQALEQFYQQVTGKEQVSASVGSNEGERNAEYDPKLKMNPKKIVPKGSAVIDAGTASGWDWMDSVHGTWKGSMSAVESKLNEVPYRRASRERGYIDTYKNPSMRELRTLSKTSAKGDVSAYLAGNDLVVWPSRGADHDEIASQLKLPSSAIPLSLVVDHGDKSALATVTHHSRNTDWHHNPETANAILSSGYMSGFSDVGVDYYDSDEVGDWDEARVHEDDADEAIGTYKTIGDFEKGTQGFRRQADRRIITNPKLVQRAKDQFARTDHPFNFYFVNLPGLGQHSEIGMVGRDWLDEKIPQASKEIPDDPTHVNIIFVGNQAAEWKPMTPWIMAHRIAHAFKTRRGPKDRLHSYNEAEEELRRTTNYIFQQAYGKASLQPQRLGGGYSPHSWEQIRLDQRTFKFFWQNVATFRSAREGKIRDWFEVIHELFAQYLITGKIKFNPLPKSLSKRQAFKTQGIYIGFKGNDQDYEYFNGMMEDLADGLESYFDNAIGEATGHFFVM